MRKFLIGLAILPLASCNLFEIGTSLPISMQGRDSYLPELTANCQELHVKLDYAGNTPGVKYEIVYTKADREAGRQIGFPASSIKTAMIWNVTSECYLGTVLKGRSKRTLSVTSPGQRSIILFSGSNEGGNKLSATDYTSLEGDFPPYIE